MPGAGERLLDPPAGLGHAATKEIRGSSLLLLGRVIAMAVNLLTQVLIVRYLTKADFGAFAYALSFVTAARVAVTLGHERTITRFLTLYEEERAYDKLFGTLIMEVVIICGMGAVLLLGTLLLQRALVRSLIDEPTAATILWIILLMAPLDALNRFTERIFAVFSHPRAIFARRYILSPLLRLSVVLALIAAHGSGVFLATGYVLASLIGLAFSFWPLPGHTARSRLAAALQPPKTHFSSPRDLRVHSTPSQH